MTLRSPNARPTLTVVTGLATGKVMALTKPRCVIGRDEGVDLRLADRAVSRHHAVVVLGPDGAVSIRDLGSTNGTFVNDTRVSGEYALAEGDEIAIGSTTLIAFAYVDETEKRPVAPPQT